MKNFAYLCAIALGLSASVAWAQTDGTRTSAGDNYGPPVSVQTVQTQFGDSMGSGTGGSEIDAVYAWNDTENLYLMFTGNLENNFNKFNLFIDSVPGAGENVITADTMNGGNNPTNDNWANKYAGMTFDAGFAADFLIICRNGNFGGDRFDLDFSTVGNDTVAISGLDVFGGMLEGSEGALSNGVTVGFNNTNSMGIAGGTAAANEVAAIAVETGIELKIPLTEIGANMGDTIKVCAMVNGSNHDFLSNQFMAGLEAPQGNLGGDGAGTFTGDLSQIDLNLFNGDQCAEIDIINVGTVDVFPDAFAVTQGQYRSGGLPELMSSDNMDLSASRLFSDLQPWVYFEVSSTSPTGAPTALTFNLESSVFARANVTQSIDLYDYDTDAWEQVDTRNAGRFGDTTVNVSPGGDLSRFVEPGTNRIEARVRYFGSNLRMNYSANNDLMSWTITN
ncbi:MAG: hypothetical protein AAF456_07005 [Planctomycetota bacterium]